MNTKDCKRFLTTDPEVQRLVSDRLGGVREIAKKTKNWKRHRKYKVTQTDLDFMLHPNKNCCLGGSAREFYLDGVEEDILILLIEVDGKIELVDDLSD